ncbi:MAG: hypothetical protein KGJ23_04185 [Euryarchaeota archaeon]|nr:hypothetical protein [Euryarchaeota archaeon]MDE1835798.1 hypothetical protein [Euryarchaeota archaeon]MDE1880728.1 hypothetical protein [Euryarchaeota archaeon]MDE2043989.1 hypothetical protein [Thermoplasmata archaeon]
MSPATEDEEPLARARDPRERGFRYLALCMAALAYLTIVLGAGVTFTGGSLSCPDWPGCTTSAPVLLAGDHTLEMSHRLAAFALALGTFGLLLLAYMAPGVRAGIRRLTALAAGSVLAQALVGGVIIFTKAALVVVVLHLALATLLFGVLLLISTLSSFPYLSPRWQKALVGALTPEGRAKEEAEHWQGSPKNAPSLDGDPTPTPPPPSASDA